MGNVRRVYAEKKADYAVAAKSLLSEIKSYLGIDTVTGVRVLIRWMICTRRPSPMRVRFFL